jgi:hypothetical protein
MGYEKIKMRPLWCREPCWICGKEGYATRTVRKPVNKPYVCAACAAAKMQAAADDDQIAEKTDDDE